MFRIFSFCWIATVALLGLSSLADDSAARDLAPMGRIDRAAVFGGDGYFEECNATIGGCVTGGQAIGGTCPPGGDCGAHCPGTQINLGCHTGWWSCDGPDTEGCDGEPLICDENFKCVSYMGEYGPNPVECGTYANCE